jgi:predicted Zn-dependent protease
VDDPHDELRCRTGSTAHGRSGTATTVVLHELGHLVGLAHVDDVNQIMFSRGGQVADYQQGDRVGLGALGKGPCQEDV